MPSENKIFRFYIGGSLTIKERDVRLLFGIMGKINKIENLVTRKDIHISLFILKVNLKPFLISALKFSPVLTKKAKL